MKTINLLVEEYGTTELLYGHEIRLTRQFNCLENWTTKKRDAVEKQCGNRSYDDWHIANTGELQKEHNNVTALAELTETSGYSSINQGTINMSYYINTGNHWTSITKTEFDSKLSDFLNN